MRKDFTEIVCIIDRSGSMGLIRDDAIGGFNSFLKDQKEVPGEASLTLVQFNNEYKVVYENENIQDVEELDENTYVPNGSTALLDAVGKTIDDVGKRLSNTPEDKKPEKVIFCILTDGHENSSRDYAKEDVKSKVEHQRNNYNWEFTFLGANIDSFAEAGSMGISANMTQNYDATAKGIVDAYTTMSSTVRSFRSNDINS